MPGAAWLSRTVLHAEAGSLPCLDASQTFWHDAGAGLPAFGADPIVDYRPLLTEAGFSVDVYEEVPGWPEPMTPPYSALLSESDALKQKMGEVATRALILELSMTLQQKPYRRRVLVAATRE